MRVRLFCLHLAEVEVKIVIFKQTCLSWTKSELFSAKIRTLTFDNFRSGGQKGRGLGGKEFLPALASCPVVNAKRSTTGVPPPPNFVPVENWRAAFFILSAVMETRQFYPNYLLSHLDNFSQNFHLLIPLCIWQHGKGRWFLVKHNLTTSMYWCTLS